MALPQTVIDYENKEDLYYQQTRPEMMAFVPGDAKTILDVGCGEGHFGRALKARQTCETWGVEMMPKAAAIAQRNMDHVLVAPFGPELGLPEKRFDCIIFNDCLEHLEDPEGALALAAKLLKPDGRLVASIPNIRYFPVMCDLVVRANWTYADHGVLDRTHLRFFTGNSIAAMFERLNYRVETLRGINSKLWGKGRKFTLLNALLLGAISDMQYQQYAVVAQLR